jgi:hypothetical protein
LCDVVVVAAATPVTDAISAVNAIAIAAFERLIRPSCV